MGSQCWGLVAGMVCVVAACGGRASDGDRAAGSAGAAPSVENAGAPAGAAPSVESAGAPAEAGAGADPGRTAEAGADAGCRSTLADLKAMDVACPAELCAGTVSALACDALPPGVIKTSEAACDGASSDATGDGLVRGLTFELSATRRKACYYEQANFEAPSLLVGAQVWEDTPSFCNGTAAQISAGVVPSTECFNASSATLCDLTDPTQSAPVRPNVPPRACFNGFSATCEPCCETKNPDCTGKAQGYPGYDCTPSAGSFCSCSCDQEQWSCAC